MNEQHSEMSEQLGGDDDDHNRQPVDTRYSDHPLAPVTVTQSSTEGSQRFAPSTPAERKHERELAREAHERDEERKDNEQRRHMQLVLFYVFVGVALVSLAFSAVVAVMADNADTRRWAQGLLITLFGTFAGTVGGYYSGRRSR